MVRLRLRGYTRLKLGRLNGPRRRNLAVRLRLRSCAWLCGRGLERPVRLSLRDAWMGLRDGLRLMFIGACRPSGQLRRGRSRLSDWRCDLRGPCYHAHWRGPRGPRDLLLLLNRNWPAGVLVEQRLTLLE